MDEEGDCAVKLVEVNNGVERKEGVRRKEEGRRGGEEGRWARTGGVKGAERAGRGRCGRGVTVCERDGEIGRMME